MKVMYYEIDKDPYIIDIEDSIESMQILVDGYIQCVYLTGNLILVCNGDGRLMNLPTNKFCNYINSNIKGNFLVCRSNYAGDDFADIEDEDIEFAKGLFK